MPKRITITLSDDLAEAAELLRKRRHYRTPTEYVQALIRYDAETQKEHHLTAEWAALTGYERDRMDAGILARVKSGEGAHGSWIERRTEEIIKRFLSRGIAPTKENVMEKLKEPPGERAEAKRDG